MTSGTISAKDRVLQGKSAIAGQAKRAARTLAAFALTASTMNANVGRADETIPSMAGLPERGHGIELRLTGGELKLSALRWTLHIDGPQGSVNLDMNRLARELREPSLSGLGQYASTTATAFVPKKIIGPIAAAFVAQRALHDGDLSALTSKGVVDGAAWAVNKASRGIVSTNLARNILGGAAVTGVAFNPEFRREYIDAIAAGKSATCGPREQSLMFTCHDALRPVVNTAFEKLQGFEL